jgi:hypothetical protein
MSTHETSIELAKNGSGDARPDFSREEAAYQRVREQLVRKHLGEYALIHHDEVVGVFPTFRDAVFEAGRRFKLADTMVREICDSDGSAYMPHVDINHASFHRLG